MATKTIETPFGRFTGNKLDGCVQYLGIKYASLEDQLAAPKMVELSSEHPVDIEATKFGPKAAGMGGPEDEQMLLIQQKIDTPAAPQSSGIDCLNLNITVPDIDVKQESKLPVMVFVHGGGFIMGSNWWPQYDPARLVNLSTKPHLVQLEEKLLPVIVVNINYRLGVLGNLTSEELRQAGYPGNNSLRDQRCAFQWIKRHISAFGGDADNVTAFGVSAGAAAVLAHLSSKEPLFKRVISMSGTPLMLKPLPIAATESSYARVMKELGLENASLDERIRHLLTIEPEALVAKTPMDVPLLPFVDGDIVPSMTTFDSLRDDANTSMDAHPWCTELLAGDCEHDGTVFTFMGLQPRKSGIASAFCASLTKHMRNPADAEAVLRMYQLSPTTPDDEAMNTILAFATDIAYHAPARAYVQAGTVSTTYYYQFNELNPWQGPFQGHATHLLDAAFLFHNYNSKLTPEACKIAEDLAKRFLIFSHGLSHFYEQSSMEMVHPFQFGPSTSELVTSQSTRSGRKGHLLEISKKDKKPHHWVDDSTLLDELSVAWDKFLTGE